jgi:hypothetical protein
MSNPNALELETMLDLRYVEMTNMSDLTNNKQRGQLCTLVVRKEKRKKKYKQLITGSNPIIICLHAPHHVEVDTATHPARR